MLGSVLAHDLCAGDRLAFVDGVAIADVEDQAGRLAHRLYAYEVVGDEPWVGLADHWEGEACEVGDVAGGCCFFEDHGLLFGIPLVVLVFHHMRDEGVFFWLDLYAFAEYWGPFVDEGVALTFKEQA